MKSKIQLLIMTFFFTLTGMPSSAQEAQIKYEFCLISKFSDRVASGGETIVKYLDIENLLKEVAPECKFERYAAALDDVLLMATPGAGGSVNVDETAMEIESNTILDLSVELHRQLF
ncbi:hypothetical protein AL036_16360 [Salipiger aestuarii]|uniref:hypothetical protein n=1 Tax=Salipiger aestuarii TaxID=568098 RepID=UPI0012387D08|nr:hypothetical protein [Salipiger aestuarii]KAA8606022.1 hypothetical protein AL036_16360 [Salipiger aestuarii]